VLAVVSRPVSGILCYPRRSESDGDHPSNAAYPRVADRSRRTSSPFSLLGLAPSGVYRAVQVALHAGALLPHRCTLTCDRRSKDQQPIGGLSLLHFRQVAPTWLTPALCSVESRLSSTRSSRAAATRPTHHRLQVYDPSTIGGTALASAHESGAGVERVSERVEARRLEVQL